MLCWLSNQPAEWPNNDPDGTVQGLIGGLRMARIRYMPVMGGVVRWLIALARLGQQRSALLEQHRRVHSRYHGLLHLQWLTISRCRVLERQIQELERQNDAGDRRDAR